ncbi:MAG TPA: penicillin-binding protein 2 [Steroidobacteraceae bacterium]|nr:penicillin-binding protein 2 [Steroidobacteraceae bacterium]
MKARSAEHDLRYQRYRWRSTLVLAFVLAGAALLAARAVELQLVEHSFLLKQGDDRALRVITIPAHRGEILDRNGEPLAISTPVDSVWVNPQVIDRNLDDLPRLAQVLRASARSLAREIAAHLDRQFLYLARHLPPDQAARVKALGIPGVYLMREYQRFYPAGEVAGHVVGFTTIDDRGQDGLELSYDQVLTGVDGAERVLQDMYGDYVQDVDNIRPPRPGRDLVTSIDLRIQYLAYRALKGAVQRYHAKAGSVTVIDCRTGEVLAMADQPSFNPNDRNQYRPNLYRNRAATDIFEPGSSVKPFIIAAALASGEYRPDSIVDTAPGYLKVDDKVFTDEQDLGPINLATILAKSSNVGAAKIALSLPPELIWKTLTNLGFGQVTGSDFPGEAAGILTNYTEWRPIHIATLSHGYGISVTPLQLAHAYATIGAYGLERPVSFVRVDGPVPGVRVIRASVARALIGLMQQVVSAGGTAPAAAVVGYKVAGKTGTAWMSDAGGYSTHKYMAVFAGLVPASHPRLAAVIVIDQPAGPLYYGGEVAAPVFSNVMTGAMRLLDVPPDDLQNAPAATLVRLDAPP